MMTEREKYPTLFIQCDWNEVLRSPESKVFLSAKYRGSRSVHGFVKSSLTSVSEKLKWICDPEYGIINHNSNALTVKHNESGLTTAFVAPMKSFKLHEKAVCSVAASDQSIGSPNALAVSSSDDDKLVVWDSRTGDELLNLKGHGGPAYRCRFFPSGTVIITASADGSLRIWSATDGICPVTLKGHTKAVKDLAIIDKGRNVISVSKDGIVKLWDVGAANCLADITKVCWEINCCCLLTTPNKHSVDNEREVATDDKLVFIGCENGSFSCSHVALREIVFEGKLDSPINCCAQIENNVIVGCENGRVVYLSGENGTILSEWWESASPVTSLCDLSNNKFSIGHMDGSCIIHSLLPQHSDVHVQLTGPDIDYVNDIAFNGRWVFTSCRDAYIRKYDFNQISVHFK